MSLRTFTTREFAELVNRDPRTLYEWSRAGRLIPKKDFSNRNIYTEQDYETVTGMKLPSSVLNGEGD